PSLRAEAEWGRPPGAAAAGAAGGWWVRPPGSPPAVRPAVWGATPCPVPKTRAEDSAALRPGDHPNARVARGACAMGPVSTGGGAVRRGAMPAQDATLAVHGSDHRR